MSETQTVHFRVGADFGVTLMQIANEHLLYTNDLDKAMNVYTESFGGGCPEDLLKELLIGNQIVLVDEEDQCFNVVERAKYPHLDSIYPAVIDLHQFVVDQQKKLDDHCDSLDRSLDSILNKFRYRKTYTLDVPVESMMKYIYGEDDEFIADMMDTLQYDDDIQQMKSLVRITRDFIEKAMKLSVMIRRLDEMYVKPDGKTKVIQHEFETHELTNLAAKIQSIARAEFSHFTQGDDEMLESYMVASKEIDVMLDKGIEPVDIMDNWSAGWLSPQGDYYALNGEIANMLHNQIGDALMEKGIVPKYASEEEQELEIENNPDSWLEQHGWVKIHGNWILYGGMFNSKLDKENVPMTDTQKNIIAEYIENCHACEVKLGFQQKRFSTGMFRAMDKHALHKHFDF